jgi:hypothetical protein
MPLSKKKKRGPGLFVPGSAWHVALKEVGRDCKRHTRGGALDGYGRPLTAEIIHIHRCFNIHHSYYISTVTT